MKKYNIVIIFIIYLFISCNKEHKLYVYYPSGKLRTMSVFPTKEDMKTGENGIITHYYESGNVRTIGIKEKGMLNGYYFAFYENGMLNNVKKYKNDTLHGVLKKYSSHGLLEQEALYLNGKPILFTLIERADSLLAFSALYQFYRIEEKYGNDTCYSTGSIIYDENGIVVEEVSLGCEVIGKDTIYKGESYNLEIISHQPTGDLFKKMTLGKMQNAIFGEFDSRLNPIDLSSCSIIQAKDNKIIYSFKPMKLGYNYIVGEIRFIKNDIEGKEESVKWHVYKLFYVKGKNEK